MSAEILEIFSNTPGLYYALAYWLGTLFYIWPLPKRLKGWKLWAAQIALVIPLSLLLYIQDFADVAWFIPNVIARVILMLLTIWLCCDVSFFKAAYFCTHAFILAELSASLEWQLFYYGLTVMGFPLQWDVNFLFLAVVHGAVFGVMYLLERKHRKEFAQMQISGKSCLSVALIGISVYIASNLSYAFGQTPFSSEFTTEIYIIRTWVDLAGVIMLHTNLIQHREMNIRMELESMQHMLRLQYANYHTFKDSVALVNRKYHDMKHQLELLRADISKDQKLEYLDRMEQEIKAYEAQNKTGNRVLDTILTAKSLQCQNMGISLTCVADGSALDFMQSMDISALFGNALDNAIESVSKISNPEKRLIHVSVAQQKQFLRIRVENCYEGELLYEDGIFRTTKKDKLHHGFGLKSMQETVQKYNGSMTIDAKDGWFELRILFPL